MKKPNIILLLLMVLACLAACHKDKQLDVKEAVVSNEEMTVSGTQARFSWQVDFAGQFQTGVEVSQSENMADLRRVEASKQEDKFVAVVDSLTEGTNYYYRFVVWNKFGSSEQSVGNFKTMETPPTPGQDTTYFEITVSVNLPEGGTATGGGRFAEGDTCRVIATANEGYVFVNWTENDNPIDTNSVYSFVVSSDRELVANFSEEGVVLYTVITKAEPVEGGMVTGGGTYEEGREIELKATANLGYTFIRWNDGSTENPRTITVMADTTYIANFHHDEYEIKVLCQPENGGTVSGGGDDFHYGDECSLTATAASGYRFVNWTKDDSVVHGEPTYSFPVRESGEYVAHFEEIAFDLVVSAQPTVIAQGGSSQLKAEASGGTGSFSYSWTPNASLNDASIYNPVASPTTTTTYTCMVTSGGQTGSGSCTVKVVCPPTDLTATVQNTNNVHLNWTAANPADSYNVYRNDTLIGQGVTNSNYDDNGLGSGTYHYRVSAVYQGVESPKSNEASATIYNSLSVTASANPVTIPDGGSSTLTAAASGGDGNYTYSWTPSTGLNNTHIQSPTATPSSTTTYTVTVGSNGQTVSDDVTVNVVKAPTNLTATVQNTNNVHLSWNATNPADSYKVYRGNTMIAQGITNTNYNDNGLSSGTYHYRVSAVYQGVESPKSNEASAAIYNSLNVTATANPVTIPDGGSSTLTATASGGDGNYTYNWTPSTGLNNTHIQSPTATPSSTTTYTVTVESNGQTASDEVTVNVVKAPTNLTATVQNTNNVHLSWNATNPADSYKVYRDNTMIAQGITNTSYNDNGLGSGTYHYRVSAVYQGVESPKSNEASATIYASLSVTASANPVTIPEGSSSTLTATASGGDGNYTYSWTPSTGLNNTQIQSPTATPSSTTTYTVTVGSNGQTASDAVTVNVVKAPTGLAATVNGNNVHLTWNHASPHTSYKVYRDNTVIAQNITATSYDDNNLNWGTTYNYQVSTVYLGVESPKSNTAQAVIPPQVPTGAINGKFTIDGSGGKVYFSQGNLQYIGSSGTWKFADTQWEVIGTSQGNTSQTTTRDLFGWGTSGWDGSGATYYRPWDTDNSNGGLYGPPGQYNLTGTYANADWGVHNPISNGGSQADQWRTLTKDEWVYVFQGRSGASSKYGHGKVNGQNGMILLPDEWTLPSGLSFTAGNSSWANVYTTEQWEQMEQNGAVFLPAAGNRNGTTVGYVGSGGVYWSASYFNSYVAYYISFGDSNLDPQIGSSRYYGLSVRLVRSAQ